MSYRIGSLRRRDARLVGPLCVWMAGSLLVLAAFGAEPPAQQASTVEPAGTFLIPAYAYDRGHNIEVCTTRYADAEPMIGNRRYPTYVEYDVEFPVAARYALRIRYSAQTARPLKLFLDGKSHGLCCRAPTGGWNTSQAAWEEACTLSIPAGRHTVRLHSDGYFPHVVSLRFDSSVALPADWKLQRPGARKLPVPPTDVNVAALRLAITDLTETFGRRYSHGPEYLSRLDVLQGRLEECRNKAGGELKAVQQALVSLRREALLANPLLEFEKLLLVKRSADSPHLGLPRNWQSNSSLPKTGYDNEIAVLEPVGPDGSLTSLFRPGGGRIVDLRGTAQITDYKIHGQAAMGGRFSVGYSQLHRFVRRPGLESDYHLLEPMEFHADTTQLVQMLAKGHYGVKLDSEGWDRLITWIDLNCPYHGTWGEDVGDPGPGRQRRRDLLKRYGNVDDDPEALPEPYGESAYCGPIEPIVPDPLPEVEPVAVDCSGWPFDAAEARRRQQSAGSTSPSTIDLGDGVTMQLALVPAGEFVMGGLDGDADERPRAQVRIETPFQMGTCEVTNRQFAQYDPNHDSRIESTLSACHGVHGHPMNSPQQPVVRVSWNQAMAFCRWLSTRTGRRFSLPTEAQWEYACRAGTATPMWYGNLDADFSQSANLADAKLSDFARDWYILDKPIPNPTKYDDWIPKDARFNDGAMISVAPGKYRPNAWGLFDMHGNVAEWTRSTYAPYSCNEGDRLENAAPDARKVVRGGSWRDRPKRCTSSCRLGYLPYQRVYNVGFRVVCEATPEPRAARELEASITASPSRSRKREGRKRGDP